MSLHDYKESQELEAKGYGFYALIMAAMRQADDMNTQRLRQVYPALFVELQQRYNAQQGLINNEEPHRPK